MYTIKQLIRSVGNISGGITCIRNKLIVSIDSLNGVGPQMIGNTLNNLNTSELINNM